MCLKGGCIAVYNWSRHPTVQSRRALYIALLTSSKQYNLSPNCIPNTDFILRFVWVLVMQINFSKHFEKWHAFPPPYPLQHQSHCTIETSQRHHRSRELVYCNRISTRAKGRWIAHRMDCYSIAVYLKADRHSPIHHWVVAVVFEYQASCAVYNKAATKAKDAKKTMHLKSKNGPPSLLLYDWR